jgi:hypothetical protein
MQIYFHRPLIPCPCVSFLCRYTCGIFVQNESLFEYCAVADFDAFVKLGHKTEVHVVDTKLT